MQGRDYQIVMELGLGDLHYFYAGLLDKEVGSPYNDQFGMNSLTGVTNGMVYLHAMGIIHRDLKSENVIITPSGLGKVADFGTAREVVSQEVSSMTAVGTSFWMAPEVGRHEPYDAKCDVYSFAILMLELCKLDFPFTRAIRMNPLPTQVKVAVDGLRPQVPGDCHESYATLMKMCWDHDPSRRPSFADIQVLLEQVKQIRIEEDDLMFSAPAHVSLPMLSKGGRATALLESETDTKQSIDHRSTPPLPPPPRPPLPLIAFQAHRRERQPHDDSPLAQGKGIAVPSDHVRSFGQRCHSRRSQRNV